MNNVIQFLAHKRHVVGGAIPLPASKCIPAWFKDIPHDIPLEDGTVKTSVKGCMPFIDAMKFGYVIRAGCDMTLRGWVEDGVKHWSANWSIPKYFDPDDLIVPHDERQLEGEPINNSGAIALKFNANFTIKTPQGYSCLITPLLNNPYLLNKGLHLYSAVVDTDHHPVPTSLPFSLTNLSGEEIAIDKGTPLAQVMPFKREDWEMEVKEQSQDELLASVQLFYSKFSATYRKLFRQPKRYK